MKNSPKSKRPSAAANRLRNGEIWEWLFLFVFIFLTLCLFLDAQLGPVGSGIRGFLLGLLGFSAYPLMIGLVVLIVIRMFWPQKRVWDKALLCLIFLLMLSVLMHLISGCAFAKGTDCFDQPSWKNGGALGLAVGSWLISFVNKTGAYLITGAAMLLIAGTLIGVSVKKALKNAAQRTAEQARELGDELSAKREERLALRSAERAAREKEEEAAEKERLARAKRTPIHDGSVDIATLDDDSYAEKKKRYEERMRQKEESGFDPYETNSDEDLIRILRGKDARITRDKAEEKPVPDPEPTVKEERPSRPKVRKAAVPEQDEKPSEIEYAARQTSEDGSYVYPSIDLLQLPYGSGAGGGHQELMQNKTILEEALLSFGVEAKVTQVNRGPAVTRYELQPKQGVKVSRIVNLADDIALNLAAPAIRIEAPIPGKSAVGIEVPNKERATVMLREVIDSPEFTKAKSKLTFALGKSIDGEIMVADVAKMPHLLIAGATGSGKSVCINSIIVSLLYKADPNEVQMMLIDPKMVELSVYNGIPHLCTPNRRVITDSKLAAAALNKMVGEMTGRYQKFAELNVRDIKGYNEAVAALDDGEHQKMPHIVIIIDELADLMMVAAKEVEEYICRLAQMARAAGMHLIIATQRPSVDVITGLIKANIPSRLAFAVSSGVDSRTILDMVGAEKLLGKGDMLFAPIGDSKPTRIQGTFISDHEVEEVVKAVSPNPTPMNQITLPELTASSSSNDSEDEEGEDEYLTQAIEQVIRSQKVSISQLQREFRIGFNRSARLVEELEERGIVSTQDGAGKRKVLVTWAEYCNTNSTD